MERTSGPPEGSGRESGNRVPRSFPCFKPDKWGDRDPQETPSTFRVVCPNVRSGFPRALRTVPDSRSPRRAADTHLCRCREGRARRARPIITGVRFASFPRQLQDDAGTGPVSPVPETVQPEFPFCLRLAPSSQEQGLSHRSPPTRPDRPAGGRPLTRAEGAAHARALSPGRCSRGAARPSGIAPQARGRLRSGTAAPRYRPASGGNARPAPPLLRPRGLRAASPAPPAPRLPARAGERPREAEPRPRWSVQSSDSKHSARHPRPGSGRAASPGPRRARTPGPGLLASAFCLPHSTAGSRRAPGRGREIPPAAVDVTDASPGLPHRGSAPSARPPGPLPDPALSSARSRLGPAPPVWPGSPLGARVAQGLGEGREAEAFPSLDICSLMVLSPWQMDGVEHI
ncbi:unnamed protein product [Rangifer tarandus platyrhynchus]|uniref:Basic proline-rich protein-like n=2 Tax=Rangifer tarandus platyrhynchus TaxID=3082113 RepID=A0ABN8ZXY1_RANTA|nr:unnamed protein product [Rangifer tarandus platyrhynchus]CAI9712007.1 unnamed protein product [Rangifer tarandus platyrhynchus]